MEAVSNAISSFVSRTKESPVQSLVIASALALVSVGAASYTGLFSSKGDQNLAPAIDEETARKIMKKILEGVHSNLSRLFQYAEQIKQQIASQGQEIDDATLLKTFLLPNLEAVLRQVQDSALEEYEVDEDELEDAVTEYIKQGDVELIRISSTIRSMFKKFGANIVDEEDEEESTKPETSTETVVSTKKNKKATSKKSKDMSLEEFLEFFRTFQNVQLELTKSALDDFVEEFGHQLTPSTTQLFQQRLLIASQQAQEAILEDFGLKPEAIEKLFMKFQSEPAVMKLNMEFEQKTVEVMQSAGITGMMGM